MAYVAVNCPNCGGSIQIDDGLKEGYCTYCSSLIKYQEVIEKLKFVKHTKGNLENLIQLINNALANGTNQTQEFKTLLYRALEQAPDNQYLIDLQASQIWNAKIHDEQLISYTGTAERIVLPDFIMIIKEDAFKKCYHLKEITLSRNIVRIDKNAFFDESNLRIHAYKNSYAAKYALASPAYLNLIDSEENYQKLIDRIETDLHKLPSIKNLRLKQIENHYNKKIQIKSTIGYVFFASIILLSFIVAMLNLNTMLTTLSIVAMFLSVGIIFSVYDITKKKYKKKIKKLGEDYYMTCNRMLRPYGIEDFELVKDIRNLSHEELLEESESLRHIIAHVKKIDKDYFI